MKTLARIIFGSQLYGTATPDSDTDIKGVFLPELDDLLLSRAPRHVNTSTKAGGGATGEKNTAADVDTEMFSLHTFIDMACEGQTNAIDMLHAAPEMWLETSPTWAALRSMRARFYTKNLKAFVGYARRQAAKYGVKGSRLATARTVLALMEQARPAVGDVAGIARMRDLEPKLQEWKLEHTHLRDDHVEVCGKKLLWGTRVSEYLDTMTRYVTTYGDRARAAELNQGIDWKAVSHALRAAFEVRSILTMGDIVFPLAEAPYLLKVKKGLLPFGEVAETLEAHMDELEKMAAESGLPEKVDREWWDKWLLNVLDREYGLRLWKAPRR